MTNIFTFISPDGMSKEAVATAFNEILREKSGDTRPNKDGRYGPWKKLSEDGNHWQLDASNDYWLHFRDDGAADLRCRYKSETNNLQDIWGTFRARFWHLLNPYPLHDD